MMRVAEWLAVVGLLACGWRAVSAQQPQLLPTITAIVGESAAAPDTTVGGALRSMASRAGLVFIGRVDKIEHKGGVFEITFRVDQVVVGTAGVTYTLREWCGLWAAGEQRYSLGQRAMVFLQGTSAAGLSSPVDGMEGVVPLVPMGADTVPLLDVRRLVARVQRLQGRPMAGEAVGLNDATAVVSHWRISIGEPQMRMLPEGWKPVLKEMPETARIVEVNHASSR
jgi:hypothetical protein